MSASGQDKVFVVVETGNMVIVRPSSGAREGNKRRAFNYLIHGCVKLPLSRIHVSGKFRQSNMFYMRVGIHGGENGFKITILLQNKVMLMHEKIGGGDMFDRLLHRSGKMDPFVAKNELGIGKIGIRFGKFDHLLFVFL